MEERFFSVSFIIVELPYLNNAVVRRRVTTTFHLQNIKRANTEVKHTWLYRPEDVGAKVVNFRNAVAIRGYFRKER